MKKNLISIHKKTFLSVLLFYTKNEIIKNKFAHSSASRNEEKLPENSAIFLFSFLGFYEVLA